MDKVLIIFNLFKDEYIISNSVFKSSWKSEPIVFLKHYVHYWTEKPDIYCLLKGDKANFEKHWAKFWDDCFEIKRTHPLLRFLRDTYRVYDEDIIDVIWLFHGLNAVLKLSFGHPA